MKIANLSRKKAYYKSHGDFKCAFSKGKETKQSTEIIDMNLVYDNRAFGE